MTNSIECNTTVRKFVLQGQPISVLFEQTKFDVYKE